MEDIILIRTVKSISTIINEGGLNSLYANKDKLKICKYLIATNSEHIPQKSTNNEDINRGSAFFIGKISDVRSSSDGRRLNLKFSQYAEVNIENVWKFKDNRNPITYTSKTKFTNTFEVRFKNLEWINFPENKSVNQIYNEIKPLTINEAKEGIAKTLAILPSCIEIIIKT